MYANVIISNIMVANAFTIQVALYILSNWLDSSINTVIVSGAINSNSTLIFGVIDTSEFFYNLNAQSLQIVASTVSIVGEI
jgi:hypothetical protein